jgi:hypothetical protein
MARQPIKDEFTDLPISRQRKYQLRMEKAGRCTECGEPAESGGRCLKHLVSARERQRKIVGAKRRYHNSLGYRLQQGKKPLEKSSAEAPAPEEPGKGRNRVQDEFTHLPISRQRKYQLRQIRDGKCVECGAPVVYGTRCLKHLTKAREQQRRIHGLKRRYKNSFSYMLKKYPERVAKFAEAIKKMEKAK